MNTNTPNYNPQIRFSIDPTGNITCSTYWPAVDPDEEKKLLANLFARIHLGEFSIINAQEILLQAKDMGQEEFGVAVIKRADNLMRRANEVPIIKPTEVLLPMRTQ